MQTVDTYDTECRVRFMCLAIRYACIDYYPNDKANIKWRRARGDGATPVAPERGSSTYNLLSMVQARRCAGRPTIFVYALLYLRSVDAESARAAHLSWLSVRDSKVRSMLIFPQEHRYGRTMDS